MQRRPTTPHAMLLHLGVKDDDCLGHLPHEPGALVRQFEAFEEQGDLQGLGRAPAAALAHTIQQFLCQFQVVERS